MKTESYFILFALITFAGCNKPVSNAETIDSTQQLNDTVVFQSLPPVETEQTDASPITPIETITQNFYGYLDYALTEDEREAKIWEVLGPLIKQYDTTQFNTISKYFVMPGTEETAEETVSTSTTVTVTLYYNDTHELKAVWREYKYEIGESGFDKISSLYLFDGDLIAFYEDKEESIDMAFQRYKRGVAKSCPDCGAILSAGVSSEEVIVSGNLTEEDFVTLAEVGRNEESILEYAYADSFQPSGGEYVYQTVEPLNEEADYDVFYTANKGYYEKFMKPKLDK